MTVANEQLKNQALRLLSKQQWYGRRAGRARRRPSTCKSGKVRKNSGRVRGKSGMTPGSEGLRNGTKSRRSPEESGRSPEWPWASQRRQVGSPALSHASKGNQRQMLIHRDGRRKSGIEAWEVRKSPEKVRKSPEKVRKIPDFPEALILKGRPQVLDPNPGSNPGAQPD